MTILLVVHDTPEPALYGLMAAIVSARRQLPLLHLTADYDTGLFPDACQHALRHGGLVTSGLLWLERMTGRSPGAALTPAACAQRAAQEDCVVPIGPSQRDALSVLIPLLEQGGVPYRLWHTLSRQGRLILEDRSGGAALGGEWQPDAFGRWHDSPPHSSPLYSSGGTDKICIALIGSRDDQAAAYPATLAALGDAADALGLALDVLFVPPKTLSPDADPLPATVGGVLLPGGADMGNVSGQLGVARYTLKHGIPTLGLCLGMQTMATAALQQLPALSRANLQEADPDAPVKTFVPLRDPNRYGVHRSGEHEMRLRAGSRLASILGAGNRLRYNHRYQLNPDLLEYLPWCGLMVSATDMAGAIADGIELAGHPFYLGVQGHPELTSAPGAAHPLMVAWLKQTARSGH
ncbi:gamma-glutamyl-gamma-aminobutyrate hydrolase family protein [Sodalis sp. dw_96]|uniref:glutamine amidotransferase-related protein n=1 Tax=Sodalis sp. dw_96 TaxID=2719794 RepID=UPI001BD2A5F0|nr:gamma-glutamyl-gamma-aminobutyrate hydrolase family protein [Sodalis sp. dw_96]